jgi:pimeloyl-ACP methyl ester carboxylesterase
VGRSARTRKHLTNLPRQARLALPWVSPQIFKRFSLDFAMWNEVQIHQRLRDEVRRQYSNVASRWAALDATCGLVLELLARKDDLDYFADIDCPVYVIGGRQDEIVPNQVLEQFAQRVRTKLTLLDNCGHAVAQDQPTECVLALRTFLERLRTPASQAGPPAKDRDDDTD